MILKRLLVILMYVLLLAPSIGHTEEMPPQMRQLLSMGQLFYGMAEQAPIEYKRQKETWLKETEDHFYSKLEGLLTAATMHTGLTALLYENKVIDEMEYHNRILALYGLLETIATFHAEYTKDASLPPLEEISALANYVGHPMTEKQLLAALPENRIGTANLGLALGGGGAATLMEWASLNELRLQLLGWVSRIIKPLDTAKKITASKTISTIALKGVRKASEDSKFKELKNVLGDSGISKTAIVQTKAIEEYVAGLKATLSVAAILYSDKEGTKLETLLKGEGNQDAKDPCEHDPESKECKERKFNVSKSESPVWKRLQQFREDIRTNGEKGVNGRDKHTNYQ